MADVAGVAGDRLKSFIERIERLEEEKRALAEDIKEVFSEAKGTGFDVKIMRQLLKIRRQDEDELDEQETLLDVYKRAIGMLPSFEGETREVETTRPPVAAPRTAIPLEDAGLRSFSCPQLSDENVPGLPHPSEAT